MPVPQYDRLFNPLLDALKALGGSASIVELDEEVTKRLKLSPAEISEPHNDRYTKLEYRLAWARTYLKHFGLLENSSRGVWVLTSKGQEVSQVDPGEVTRYVRQKTRASRTAAQSDGVSNIEARVVAEAELEHSWKERLLMVLRNLPPDAFERLCQRLLRESGFVQVKVTGRTGDGGIDGVGLVQLGGLLSFPVIFQCKRVQGSIGASVIRDFRGAMVGRADRGLVLTTGTFSRDARLEATRDGAPPIDLVDAERLMEKLKELRLGISVQMIEDVTVMLNWFNEI